MGGFEVAPALYVDAGFRHFDVKMTAAVLEFPQVTWRPGIWESVVGVTFRPKLGKNVRLFSQTNFGGMGDASHRTVAATAVVEWKPSTHLVVGAGYGLLHLRADGSMLGRPVHFAQTLNGPMLTLGVPF
jgi:hypothetical protein